MKYIVVEEHVSDYPEPLMVEKGDKLSVGEKYEGPEGWENWLYCTVIKSGLKGWVPGQLLTIQGKIGTITENYTARELNVVKDEIVEGYQELNGWQWCVKARSGGSGWLPKKNIKPY